MNNTLKKIVASITVLTCAACMMGPGVAQALTVNELLALIAGADSLEDLQADIAAAQAEDEEEEVTIEGVPADFTFETNLKLADTGDDVKYLQIVLNSDSDTQLAESGVGSAGNETSYFGPLTKGAVIKFQELYTEDCLASWGLTEGTGYVGSTTRAKLNELLGEVVPPTECTVDADCPAGYTCTAEVCVKVPVAAGLTAALAATTPASTSIISFGTTGGQAQVLVPFTTVNFTAGSEGSVTVTTLEFTRIGIASDANLDTTYLYEGDAKLLEGGTISSKVLTFNDATGIFTVPSGETKSITLKGNLNSAVSAGKTIGFSLVSADDITSDASAVSGTFPAAGNLMTVATADDLGYASISGSYATPSSPNATVTPQDDYMVWSFSLTAENQDLSVERLVFTEVGSILSDDLQNFELYVGGSVIGTAEMDSNYQVVFDLSDSPLAITKGQAKTLKLYADLVKGATKTFKFTFQYPTDLAIMDDNYGVYVGSYVTLASGWTLVQPGGNYQISAGSLSVTKATNSPTGDVARDATNILVAKYEFKAVGEDVKVNSLKISANTYASDDNGLDNGRIYLDGVQVGSTRDLGEYAAPTTFTFGSSFIVSAGVTSIVEIKADIKDILAASLTADQDITIYIEDTTSNAQGVSSLTVLNIPDVEKSANALTVTAGTLTFSKNTAYGLQYFAIPATKAKIGSFVLLAGSSEGVNIDSITVTIEDANDEYMEDVILQEGSTVIGTEILNPSTSNLFSTNLDLAIGGSKTIDVYADLLTGFTTFTTPLTVAATGITADTSTSVNAQTTAAATTLALQAITAGDSSITVALASDTPDPAIILGQTPGQVVAKYTFSTLLEPYTVSEAKIRVNGGAMDDFVSFYLVYQDSGNNTITSSAKALGVDGTVAFTGMTLYAEANSDADMVVHGNLNAVATTGYANTGDQPRPELVYYKANSSSQPSVTRNIVTSEVNNGGTVVRSTDKYAGTYAALLTAQDSDGWSRMTVPMNILPSALDAPTWYHKTTGTVNAGSAGLSFMLGDGTEMNQDWAASTSSYALRTLSVADSSVWQLAGPSAAAIKTLDGTMDNYVVPGWVYWNAVKSYCDTNSLLITETRLINWADGGNTWFIDNFVIEVVSGTSRTYDFELANYADGPVEAPGRMFLHKTVPTVNLSGLSSATLVPGKVSLYTFTVAADTKGNVGLKNLTFSIAGSGTDPEITYLELWRGNTEITDEVKIGTTYDNAGLEDSTKVIDVGGAVVADDIYVTFETEEVITADTSQTYYLKGTAANIAIGDAISTYIYVDAAVRDDSYKTTPDTYANVVTATKLFIWSDRSATSHAQTTSDWLSGYLVNTLDSDLFTLYK